MIRLLLTLVASAVGGYLGTWLYIRTHGEKPKALQVPRPGTLARAISYDRSPLGVVRVEESDELGDVVGPWWSGTLLSTGERLLRLRPCHYAGPAGPEPLRCQHGRVGGAFCPHCLPAGSA